MFKKKAKEEKPEKHEDETKEHPAPKTFKEVYAESSKGTLDGLNTVAIGKESPCTVCGSAVTPGAVCSVDGFRAA